MIKLSINVQICYGDNHVGIPLGNKCWRVFHEFLLIKKKILCKNKMLDVLFSCFILWIFEKILIFLFHQILLASPNPNLPFIHPLFLYPVPKNENQFQKSVNQLLEKKDSNHIFTKKNIY